MVPHCFNANSLQFDGSYRIRSDDVSRAKNGNLNYVDPCNGGQDSSGNNGSPNGGKNAENNGGNNGDNNGKNNGNNEGNNNSNNNGDNNGNNFNDNRINSSPERRPNQRLNFQQGGRGKLISLRLVDSSNGNIKDFAFNSEFDVSSFKDKMSIKVDINNVHNVKQINFYVDGKHVKTESVPPYYIAGDTGGRVIPWNAPLNSKVALRIEVIGNDGQIDDHWTVYPTFKANGSSARFLIDGKNDLSGDAIDEPFSGEGDDIELVVD